LNFAPSELYAIGEKRRELEKARAEQRRHEGWKKRGKKGEEPSVNVTEDTQGDSRDAIAEAAGKRWVDYHRLQSTQEFLEELSSEVGIPTSELIQSVSGGHPELQGT